jgi:magnesium transporter
VLTIHHLSGDTARTIPRDEVEAARSAGGWVWVDLAAPTDAEESILQELGLHAMAIEDMREDRHLPKLEAYADGEIALVVHGMRVDDAAEELRTVELDIWLERDLLVTFHEEPMASVDVVTARLDRVGLGPQASSPVRMLHLILDTMNDVFVPFVEHVEKRIDVIEDDLLSTPTEETRRDIYRLQRDVIQLRRAVVPQAEVIRRLGRESVGLISEDEQALFRDIYDHLYRMAELSDSYRQLLDSAIDSYRSSKDSELNDMLRILTLISALLLPMTLIAGIYGTNFHYLPELSWQPAYFVMWGVFVTITVTMLLWFRQRGWIGRSAEREAERRRSALGAALDVPVLGTVLRIPVRSVRAVTRRRNNH